MNRPTLFSLLVICWGTNAFSDQVELTGLIDLAGCRMACFRIPRNGATPVLRPGQSSEGITLESLDARTGSAWVLTERGTIQVRLASFCALPEEAAKRPTNRPAPRSSVTATGVSTPDAAPLNLVLPADGGLGVADSQTPMRQFAVAVPAVTLYPVTADSSATRVAQPQNTAEQVLSSTEQSFENIPPATTSTSPNASSLDRPIHRPSPESDPTYLEGERIKMQYGLEAFLAWDLARGQAALEGK